MTVSVTYVTTDPSGRWTGTGSPILPAQVDENFYLINKAVEDIVLLEPVSIASITASGTTMVIDYTDSSQTTVQMPYPIYTSRGLWQADTAYSPMDCFYYGRCAFFVNYAHTSAATFNPNATDGSGRYLYTLVIDTAAGSIPAGGVKGAVLTKSSASDYAVAWTSSINLPVYGATSISGVATLDKANGECQRVSLTGNVTSLTVSNFGIAGQCSKLVLEVWNTGAYTLAWPTGTIWPGGSVPTVTSGIGKKDVFVLLTMDGGTTIYGTIVGQDFS